MDLAAQWLSYCLEHDSDCELPDRDFWPRRLIDMGSWDGSRQPCLFEASDPVVYACLGYFWGPDVENVLQTTTRDDKLRAVSGLAKIVHTGFPGQNKAPDEYLAGLWRREFHFDLTWRVVQFVTEREPMPPNDRDRDGVLLHNPTKSWAPVDGAVDYSFSGPLETWKYEPKLLNCIQVQSVSCLRANR
jgi:hypothetical protein